MTKLQTTVQIPKPGFNINYNSSLVTIGSCFADTVGKQLEYQKFNICVNPYGVLYNPLSVANGLKLLIDNEAFTEDDLCFNNELWFSFYHYTLYSHINKEQCLQKINTDFTRAQQFIRSANVLFITLGTSWYYTYKKTNAIVANCHKIPSEKFNREFSTTHNSIQVLSESITRIAEVNPDLQIVFTVSPIRHWKDGAIENQRSKAALITTIHELKSLFTNVYYFPVYEVFMDELRDYRFYAPDMLHPSEQAREIIWNKFSDTFFDNETRSLVNKIYKIKQSLEHKPRFANTKAYQDFMITLKEKIAKLETQFPFLDFSK